jgi:hypothetical protein
MTTNPREDLRGAINDIEREDALHKIALSEATKYCSRKSRFNIEAAITAADAFYRFLKGQEQDAAAIRGGV